MIIALIISISLSTSLLEPSGHVTEYYPDVSINSGQE